MKISIRLNIGENIKAYLKRDFAIIHKNVFSLKKNDYIDGRLCFLKMNREDISAFWDVSNLDKYNNFVTSK